MSDVEQENIIIQETVETPRTQIAAMQEANVGQWPTLSVDLSATASSITGRFRVTLSGTALAWFQTLLDETRNSYNDLITALRQRFASPSIQFLQRQELNDQKQGNGERHSKMQPPGNKRHKQNELFHIWSQQRVKAACYSKPPRDIRRRRVAGTSERCR